jgi:hypothetical protein
MATFLTDSALNAQLESMIKEANEHILLFSPYIKLHTRIKNLLEQKKQNPAVGIFVMFGKNGKGYESISKDDIDFFRGFPRVEIRHEPRLHAKYYASEKTAILSSMNLYDFSQNNNIEFGIQLTSQGITSLIGPHLGSTTAKLDEAASKYFLERFIQSQQLFLREAKFEKGLLGFGNKYIKSETKVDELDNFFNGNWIPYQRK